MAQKPLTRSMNTILTENFQALRRTHASLGHKAGIDPKVSADQRGHGIGVALDVYTKAALSTRAEAAKQLEESILAA